MCGIAGGWCAKGITKPKLREALETIKHRGPDDTGILVHDNQFLGMQRLSIIDIDGGNQPIFNEDHTVAVIQNGEVYNYKELIPPLEAQGHVFRTRSDTEVLVHLYEQYGTAMCEHLRGMYAFAILDMKQSVLYIGRDRYGKKPLYYKRTQDGGLIFASELKGLRALATLFDEPITIRDQGVYDFLSLGVAPQPTTIFQDVYALPSASWMRFDGNNHHIEKYWQLNYTKNPNITYEEALERVRDLLSTAVRIRLRSDVPVGVLLSGGIDSSIVAYEAAQELGGTLQSFTIGVDDDYYDESNVARRTARSIGIQNLVLPIEFSPINELQYLVRQYDQPFADPSAIPSLAVARLARQHVKVVLNGDGGDELFGGYRRYVAAVQTEKFRWMPATAASVIAKGLEAVATERRSTLGLGARFVRSLAYEAGEQYLIRTRDMLHETDKRKIWRKDSMRPTEEWIENAVNIEGLSELDAQFCRDVQITLLSTLLVKMDMATMAASLEGRSPFMDHVVGEFAMTLPAHFHIQGSRTKTLLRDAYRGRIPDEVFDAPKRGFEIPLASWLKSDLQSILMDTLLVKSAKVRAFVDDDYVDDLVSGKIMQERNWAYLVYSLLVLELWLREFDAAA